MPLDNLHEMEREALIARQRALIAPQALPAETFLAWSQDVHLEESDREILNDMVEAYALRLPALEKDLRAKILERWPASFQFDREARAIVPILSPQLLELYDLHERLVERVLDLERPIVSALSAPLDSAGQSRIEANWLARLRRLRGLSPPVAPMQSLDPVELIAALELDETDQAQIEPLIAQYRADMIRLLEGRDGATAPVEAEAMAARMLVELGPAWELFFEPAEVAAMEEQLRAQTRPLMLDRAAELNHRLVGEAAPLLPPRQSIELRSLYFQELLPEFFEEEREMLALADTVAALLEEVEGEDAAAVREGLDRALVVASDELDASAEAALALDESARAESSLSTAQLHDSATEISRAVAALRAEHDLLELRRERRRVINRAVDSLQTVAQHSAEYQSLRETFNQFRRIQRAREEADLFRQRALAERVLGLEDLVREREGD